MALAPVPPPRAEPAASRSIALARTVEISGRWVSLWLRKGPSGALVRSPWTAADALVRPGAGCGRGRPPHKDSLLRRYLSEVHTHLAVCTNSTSTLTGPTTTAFFLLSWEENRKLALLRGET